MDQAVISEGKGKRAETVGVMVYAPTDKAVEDNFNKSNLKLEVLTIDKAGSTSLRCFGVKDSLSLYLRFDPLLKHRQFNTSSSPYEEGFRYSLELSGKAEVMDFLKEMGIAKCYPGLDIPELKGKRVAMFFDDKGYARAVSPINKSLGGIYFDKSNYIRSVFIDNHKKSKRNN